MRSQQSWFTTAESARYLNVNVQSFKSVMTRNNCVALRTSKNGDYRWHRAQLDAFRIYNSRKPTIKQQLKLALLNWAFSD